MAKLSVRIHRQESNRTFTVSFKTCTEQRRSIPFEFTIPMPPPNG